MITITLLIIASASNAVMDILTNFYPVSIFKKLNPLFWNPRVSYLNKWKVFDSKEKFFGSSTFLVFLTDGWHLFKALWLLSLIGAIIAYKPIFNWWIDGIGLMIIWGIIFELTYRNLKSK